MTTKLASTLESFLVAQFRDNPPTGTPIPDPDPYAVTFSKTIAVVGGLAVTYDEVAEQVVLDGSGAGSPEPTWTRPNTSTYNAPAARKQFILLTTEVQVNLPADVEEGDEVVIKCRSLDNPCTVASLASGVTFDNNSGDFSASTLTISSNSQVVRLKYTASSGQGGAATAYLQW